MSAKTIAKIVFLVIMTICALLAVFAKIIYSAKNNPQNVYRARKVMRFRLICFVAMLVCLLICILI